MWYGILGIIAGGLLVYNGFQIIKNKRIVRYTLLYPKGHVTTGFWAQVQGVFWVMGGLIIVFLGILGLDKETAESCARAINTIGKGL